eukprot:g5846.t1
MLLIAPRSEILDKLIQISDPHLIQSWFHDDTFTKGELEVVIPVFAFQQYPINWIGFVKIFLVPTREDSCHEVKLLIWMHPSAQTEIQKAIQCCLNSNIHMMNFNFQRLELLGGQSINCLKSLIPDLPPIDDHLMTSGRILGIRCVDPRLFKCKHPNHGPLLHASTITTELTSCLHCFQEDKIPRPFSEKKINNYWQAFKQQEIYAQEKETLDDLAGSESLMREEDKESAFVHCWLVFHSPTSCSLCLPKHWTLPFWKKLVLSGCKVAGQDDWEMTRYSNQLVPYPEAFSKMESQLEPIFTPQQLQDWPKDTDGAILVKVGIVGKGVCKLQAQVLVADTKLSNEESDTCGICGEIVWSIRAGVRGYPGGLASCRLSLLSKALSIDREQIMDHYQQEIKLFVKNPGSTAMRSAVGQITFINKLETQTI